MPVTLLIVLLVSAEAVCAAVSWLTMSRLRTAESQTRRLRCAVSEITRYADARKQLRKRQQKIEHAVDSTTGSVEAVHRALADFSFDLWGRDADRARLMHNERADQVYDTVRSANKIVGKWTSGWLNGDSSKNNDA